MIQSALELPGARQAALDAAAALLLARQAELGRLDERGRPARPEVTVVATGPDINRMVLSLCQGAREILSVRGPVWTASAILRSHPANVALLQTGVRMVSLFDAGSRADCEVLSSLRGAPYEMCHGPVEMKVFDRRRVLMDGPVIDGEESIVTLTSPRVVREALRYVQVVGGTAVPVARFGQDAPKLTSRQSDIAVLLAEERSDEAIAAALGVSVRTVRGDIAGLLRTLGVRTRFAAGYRLGRQHAAKGT